MSNDLTSTGFENYRTYRATGFAVSVRPLRDGVQIRWENTLSSEYPIIRGFRKTGGLNEIEKSEYLISDSSEERGELIDRLEKGSTFFYLFRSYLNYIPGSAEDPSVGKIFDELEREREKRWNSMVGPPPSNRFSAWLQGYDKEGYEKAKYEYENPTPKEKINKEKDESIDPFTAILGGIFMHSIMRQRGDENAPPIVKAINQFAFNDGVNRLEATASPYYLTFQYSIPNEIERNEDDFVRGKIDGVINKEKLKWERIESLEKEYMSKNKDIMNSNLPDAEKLNKLKLLQESYADLMDKVRNM